MKIIQMLTKLENQLSFIKSKLIRLLVLTLFSALQVFGQDSGTNNLTILGNWQGQIVINKEKSVGILWRFEKTTNGSLIGFMGPASKGIATLPMSDIIIKDSLLTFAIHSEGSYRGKISKTRIEGVWNSKSGRKLVHIMARNSIKQGVVRTDAEHDIHASIKAGDIARVKRFLNEGHDINKVYDKGYTLLLYAIKKDRSNTIVPYLLTQGANPNVTIEGISPLMYAVAYRKYSIIKALVASKASVDYVSTASESALVFAIKERNAKAVQLLLELGANPSQEIREKYTAIDLAKEENIREILHALNIPYHGVNDGPYVKETISGRTAIWLYKGKKHVKKIGSKNPTTIKYKGVEATLWEKNPTEVTQLEYNGTFNVGAISDIHGQYTTLLKLLKNNKVINKKGKWNFGNGHFVIVGDIFDRGPAVTEVLWFLYDLEKQAEKKGGKLHVLLGNHDVMVLNGNLRSVHPKYKEAAEILERPFNTLFTKGTVLGDWLRTRPVIVKINGLLFTHGGLHPDFVTKSVSIENINTEFKKQLIESELGRSRDEYGSFLHRGHGPIYYRGYFQGKRATDTQIDELLEHFNASNIIVGHTTHRQIETRYKGKVIVVDANMKSGAMGEVLLWEDGRFFRGNITGKRMSLEKSK